MSLLWMLRKRTCGKATFIIISIHIYHIKQILGGFETKGNEQGGCEWIQGIVSKRKRRERSKWAQNTFIQVEQVV